MLTLGTWLAAILVVTRLSLLETRHAALRRANDVAIPLLFGRLTAADYEDDIANDPRVDALRAKYGLSAAAAVEKLRPYLEQPSRPRKAASATKA